MLVLDSGGLSRLATRSRGSLALIQALIEADLWPPIVPTMVLVESLHDHAGRDAATHRFLKACIIEPSVPAALARRAAGLRTRARTGSAVDALVVALAEPGGTALTGDAADLRALASHADAVAVEVV